MPEQGGSHAGTYSGYDPLAWFYNRYWGEYSARVLPVVENLVLSMLAPRARILDLCCGTGQMARLLTDRGYQVVGIDGSAQMLAFARQNAPGAAFVQADARWFNLAPSFHAVLSLFDSLNHVMSLDELAAVFRNVYAALVPGGRFLFDLNTRTGYETRWAGSSSGLVGDDHALIQRSSFDPSQGVARMEFTLFRLEQGAWRRTDLALEQRVYAEEQVRGALERAGFSTAAVYTPWGPGRAFYLVDRPEQF
ncbi:MAG: class I SAM-dependent methyltransferase [Limnochordaceae bacterium]|nr:class I SAM-dependent methyltransferase [Limnochordaceae bacterium]